MGWERRLRTPRRGNPPGGAGSGWLEAGLGEGGDASLDALPRFAGEVYRCAAVPVTLNVLYSRCMTLPFTLPDWLPWWVPILFLVPALLYALAFLFMPFSVIGVKSRLEAVEARLDEI